MSPDQSPWRGANVQPLDRNDAEELAELWHLAPPERGEVHPKRHIGGWATVPCRCAVCRADRWVERAAGVVVGLCVGYLIAHVAFAALR